MREQEVWIAVVLMIVLGASPLVAQVRWGDDVRITDATQDAGWPKLTALQDGTLYAACSLEGISDAGLYRSDDGGQNWTLDRYITSSDPLTPLSIAAAEGDSPGGRRLFVALRAGTFIHQFRVWWLDLDTGSTGYGVVANGYPDWYLSGGALCVDDREHATDWRVYIGYAGFDGGAGTFYLSALSEDFGATWTDNTSMDSVQGPDNPMPELSYGHGVLYYVYSVGWPANSPEIRLKRSLNRGETWEAYQTVESSDFSLGSATIVASRSEPTVVTCFSDAETADLAVRLSRDAGVTWTAVIPPNDPSEPDGSPRLALCEQDEKLALAWIRGGIAGNQVMVSECALSSPTIWTAAEGIVDGGGDPTGSPSLALDPARNDATCVAWRDRRDQPILTTWFDSQALGTGIVCPDGSGDFTTIQEAIDASWHGDTVELCDGVFTGPLNRDLDFGGKAITVRSQSGDPTACIIDCEGVSRAFWFHSGEDASAVLEAITVRNGHAVDSYSTADGGAILCNGLPSSPTITGCIFEDCTADDDGGALGIGNGSFPTVADCSFVDNTCVDNGGAIYISSAGSIITDCHIEGNEAGNDGGAIFCLNATESQFTSCVIIGNRSLDEGPGICCWTSTATAAECLIVDNVAEGQWGGAALATQGGMLTLESCTLSGNSGVLAGGLIVDAGAELNVRNTIIAFGPVGAAAFCGSGTITLVCCDLYGNAGGDYVGCVSGMNGVDGNFSANPGFCDPSEGDYQVNFASPCLPANNTCGVLIGAFDEGCVATSVPVESELPSVTQLLKAYPSPFNPRVTISFALEQPDRVELAVYSVPGRRVRTLVNEDRTAGMYEEVWDGLDDGGRRMPSGVYFCRMSAGSYGGTLRLVLVR